MFYVLAVMVALQLVVGQSLWKLATEKADFSLSAQYIFSTQVFRFLFSPYFIAGCVIYVVATLLYMGLLAKYQYSTVQGAVVPLSLIMAFLIGRAFFHDRLSLTNIIGLVILVIGIYFATKR